MADDAGRLNEVLAETSFLGGGNAPFVEDLYARWAGDPAGVDPSWRAFFASLADRIDTARAGARRPSWTPEPAATAQISSADPLPSAQEVRARTLDSLRAIMMIRAYRMRGHLKANLDPLGLAVTAGDASELDPASYGFAEADFDRPIFLDFVLGMESATLREILALLKRTYCGTIGVQYMHITDPREKAWLQRRIEGWDKEIRFTREGKIA
ncbi:MAG: 2-oxoglutarate dehydrogenase E1 component, partial [Caulobacteraceae bacterium]